MTVIPELSFRDPPAAEAMLRGVFGFAPDGPGGLVLGDQRLRLVAGAPGAAGPIDHLALAVPDLEQAAAGMQARGARVDRAVTPDGPGHIAEFWGGGVRYLFLQGPEGLRLELCQNLAAPQGPGHDHIGLPTGELAALERFFLDLGAVRAAAVTLQRAAGTTEVRFLRLGTSMLELYQPPGLVEAPGPGPLHRLLVPGALAATGPGGVCVAPA